MGDRLLLADRTDKKCDRNWNWEGVVGRGMVGEGCGGMGIPPGGGRLRPTERGGMAGIGEKNVNTVQLLQYE